MQHQYVYITFKMINWCSMWALDPQTKWSNSLLDLTHRIFSATADLSVVTQTAATLALNKLEHHKLAKN